MAAAGKPVSHLGFAMGLILLFLASYVAARSAGLWHNEISDTEYVERLRSIDAGEYGHPGS